MTTSHQSSLPHVVVLGSTGSGKSSLCNALIGEDSVDGPFPVSDKLSACTFKTSVRKAKWKGRGSDFVLIDTPGLDDPQGRDSQHISDIVHVLKEVRNINLFIIVINSQRPRMDGGLKSMFKLFEGMFGNKFWKNSVIEFSRWSFDSRADRLRLKDATTMDSQSALVNGFFKTELSVSENLPCVFVDSCYDNEEASEISRYQQEMEKLEKMLKTNQPYECKDIQEILTEKEQLEIEIKEAEKVIEQKKADIKKYQLETKWLEEQTAEAESRAHIAALNLETTKRKQKDVEKKSGEEIAIAEKEILKLRQEIDATKKKNEKAEADFKREKDRLQHEQSEEIKQKSSELRSLQEQNNSSTLSSRPAVFGIHQVTVIRQEGPFIHAARRTTIIGGNVSNQHSSSSDDEDDSFISDLLLR